MISGSLGKNGWIKWNYYRTYEDPWPEIDFDVQLTPKNKSKIIDFKTAGINVAKDIGSSYDNIYLALSGGIDSEFAAECFLKAGVPFTPIIANIKGSNEIDSWFAYRWCKEKNIQPLTMDITVRQVKEANIDILKKTFIRLSIAVSFSLILNEHVKKLNGNLVTGGGDIEYFPDSLYFYRVKAAKIPHSFQKDLELFDEDGTPKCKGWLFADSFIGTTIFLKDAPWNFYTWTPEIVLSMIANRDLSKDTQENKIALTECMPRPKNIPLTKEFNRSHNELINLFTLRIMLGKTENYFLGTKEELINLLS